MSQPPSCIKYTSPHPLENIVLSLINVFLMYVHLFTNLTYIFWVYWDFLSVPTVDLTVFGWVLFALMIINFIVAFQNYAHNYHDFNVGIIQGAVYGISYFAQLLGIAAFGYYLELYLTDWIQPDDRYWFIYAMVVAPLGFIHAITFRAKSNEESNTTQNIQHVTPEVKVLMYKV